ncbi:MAG: TfoX/Sxy family protein [Zoogloea sp.]|nr:TfoX/Sxy family protein [Zoogloea sp.]
MARKPQPEIVSHALELLAPLGGLRVKGMFGGWGFYSEELFFALVADEVLYLKADADSQAAFEAAGSLPFSYTNGDGKRFTMGYWSAPEEALDSPAAMLPWARMALACALRARGRKPARRSKPSA